MAFPFKVYRTWKHGSQTTGPSKIAEFMNQVDAENFAGGEATRGTNTGEDISIAVRRGHEEVGLYHSGPARDRLGIERLDVRVYTYNQLVRAIQNILPDHQFDTDNEGQLIIYTGAQLSGPDGSYLTYDASLAGT